MNIKEVLSSSLLPRNDLEHILTHELKCDKIALHLNPNQEVPPIALEHIKTVKEGYPIEYLYEEVFFYGEKFMIKEGVLIPRDDTETLIDVVLQEIDPLNTFTFAEVGVGSGAISVTLARTFKNARFIATDINPLALEVTQKNASLHNVEITLHHTSILDSVTDKIDIIVSNPPYVETTHPKPNEYEPDEAFFSEDEGMAIIKAIIDESFKREVAYLFLEIGFLQAKKVITYARNFDIKEIKTYKDLSGNDRVVAVKF